MTDAPTTCMSYRLAFREGRPIIVSSTGEVLPPSTYCDCIVWPFDDWIARNRDFVESGIASLFPLAEMPLGDDVMLVLAR